MALNVGDAFLTFRGDLTELNLAFDQAAQSAEKLAPAQAQVDALGAGFDRVATGAEQAAAGMAAAGETGAQAGSQIQTAWQAVAKATVENYQAQQELSKAMYAVKSTAGGSAEAVSRLALAQERAATTSAQLTEARAAATDAELRFAEAEKAAATAAADLLFQEYRVGEAAQVAGTQMKIAGEEGAFSMREATGTMALAGEEMGVVIPRHLRSFVAELPGVGAAMEAAFSGVALLVLAQLIVEATQKLTEFISETFIYTEADKKAYEAQVELNKAIADQATKIKELKDAYDLLGLNGSQRTAAQFMKLTEEVRNQEAALRDAQNTLYEYRNGLNDVTEEQAAAAQILIAKLSGASGQLMALYLQQATLSKQYDQELLSEQIASGEKVVNNDKTVGEARIALLQAQSRLRLAMVTNSYYEQGQAQARFDEQRYQLELGTLERLRTVAAQDPNNPDKVRDLNAQIEALQKNHFAKLINDSVDFYEKIKALQKQAQPEDVKVPDTAIELSDAGKAILQLQEGLTALGIQGSATWMEQKIDAVTAYEKIRATGLATYTDLEQALLKVKQAELGEALAIGNTSAAEKYKKEIADITKELKKLGIITDQTSVKTRAYGDVVLKKLGVDIEQLRKHLQDMGLDTSSLSTTTGVAMLGIAGAVQTMSLAWAQGGVTVGQAAKQMAEAVLQSLATYAFAKGTEQLAIGWAEWPAGNNHFVSAAEWFAAGGIASISSGLIANAGGSSGAASTSSGVSVAPGDATPATNPTPVTNIQRFATGGLVSSPTLALIGDSISSASRAASEAILPLEDPRAMSRIAGAITAQMSGGGGGTVNHFHIEGMISDDKLDNIIRKINRRVQNNGVKLTASNALRVTKKA